MAPVTTAGISQRVLLSTQPTECRAGLQSDYAGSFGPVQPSQ